MGNSAKPRKAYRPSQPTIPKILGVKMTADMHPDLAMQLHLATVSLIERPTIAACNHLSRQFCEIAGGMSHAAKGAAILGRTDAASIAINSAIRAIESIVDRHERTGAVAVSQIEAKTLKAAAGKLDTAIGRIPFGAYRLAKAEVMALVPE